MNGARRIFFAWLAAEIRTDASLVAGLAARLARLAAACDARASAYQVGRRRDAD